MVRNDYIQTYLPNLPKRLKITSEIITETVTVCMNLFMLRLRVFTNVRFIVYVTPESLKLTHGIDDIFCVIEIISLFGYASSLYYVMFCIKQIS